MLVILVPVLFGFMGFAVDLGRLYMIRGELKTAADAMALAAAQQLIGTADADARATDALEVARTNRYDYGGMLVGETTGNFTSTVEWAFSGDLDGAIPVDTAQNRYARVTITADAPLVFFRLFAIAQEGRTQVMTRSVAGVSAPLCTACGIEPIVISRFNPAVDDLEHFGFTIGDSYQFGHKCTGPNQPQPGYQRYVLLDRFSTIPTGLPQDAALRAGAFGLSTIAGPASGCVRATTLTSTEESPLFVQTAACPLAGNPTQPPELVTRFLCGLSSRTGDSGGCDEGAFSSDSDTLSTDYPSYTGDLRRVITAIIVDEDLGGTTTVPPDQVTVLGFRQFLVNRFTPTDPFGRFNATYLGYPMPLRQGSISTAPDENGYPCSVAIGPGKVVLHQ
jgi:hypothetical protein